ncbi:MAG TPA: type II toxin-antitoxin system HigB family toxin [Lacipirellulaceae bacterium]
MKRVVSPKRIWEYAARYPSAKPSLEHWLATIRRGEWNNPAELKQSFNDVDRVTVESGRTVFVFNIEHNRHRLIAAIHFNTQAVYVLRIMTHKEYDRSRWKDEL